VAGDECDAAAHHLVGDRDGLARVARVVADLESQLAAEHAARGVDVAHRHLARRRICSPNDAYCPVIGPTVAIVISCACTVPPMSSAAAAANNPRMIYSPTLLVAVSRLYAPRARVKMARWTSARRAGIAIVMNERPISDLVLVGGRACFDFTNTTSGRGGSRHLEHLTTAQRIVDWAKHAGVVDATEHRRIRAGLAAEAPLLTQEALALREGFYRLFAAIAAGRAPDAADLALLNRWVERVYPHVAVVSTDAGFALGWQPEPATPMRSCAGWCARRSTC
jgi:hypothetical protein